MLDLKIVNGTLVDGTGAPGRHADVGIRNGRIAAVGRVGEAAGQTIDAEGKIVAPGFIDCHTHYDAQVFWDPLLSPSCYHGVTTVIGGNCGFSIAPLSGESAAYLGPMLSRVEGMPLESLQQGVPWNWKSFGDYLSRFEGTLGLNAAFMVGHSAVRRAVMGKRAVGELATEAELNAMRKLVDDALGEGALGLSTTVSVNHNDGDGNPVPSRHASREELLSLAEVCSRHEGTCLELLPNLHFDPDTVQLLTDFALAGQRPVNWNTLTVRRDTPEDLARMERMLAASDYARARGASVFPLVMVASGNPRINLFSGFVFDGFPNWAELFRVPVAERMKRLQDADYRQYLFDQSQSPANVIRFLAYWDRYLLLEAHSERFKSAEGQPLTRIGKELGKTPFETLIHIALESGLKASFATPPTGDDLETFQLRASLWQDERTIVGASDAGAHLDMIDSFAFSTAMLQKGVRQYGVISLEAAVHQLTQVPAASFGIRERGAIRDNWHADVVVFDPSSVGRGETYTRFDMPAGAGRLYADATGVDHVIVNGRVIVEEGRHTGRTPGKLLRSGRDTYTYRPPAH